MQFKNKWVVYQGGKAIGTTWAVSEKQAVNNIRWRSGLGGCVEEYKAKRVSNKPESEAAS